MLIGQVTAENQAVVPIEVHGSEGHKAHIDATMAMLLGCRLTLDVEAGGPVSIESLTQVRTVN